MTNKKQQLWRFDWLNVNINEYYLKSLLWKYWFTRSPWESYTFSHRVDGIYKYEFNELSQKYTRWIDIKEGDINHYEKKTADKHFFITLWIREYYKLCAWERSIFLYKLEDAINEGCDCLKWLLKILEWWKTNKYNQLSTFLTNNND